jgi:hypothetical protein
VRLLLKSRLRYFTYPLDDPQEIDNRWLDATAADMKHELLAILREWRIRSQYHTADWAADWR